MTNIGNLMELKYYYKLKKRKKVNNLYNIYLYIVYFLMYYKVYLPIKYTNY